MSLLSKAWKSIRGVAAPLIGGLVGGPAGAALGTVLAGSGSRNITAQPRFADTQINGGGTFPGVGMTRPVMAGRGLLALPGAGGAVVRGGMAVARSAGAVTRSAIAYCKRHPAWCAGAGGLAAVEALVSGGQLPPMKRRRSRGITGTELRNFRRVSRVLDRWCKTPPPRKPRARSC